MTVIVRDVTLHEVVCDLPRCPAHLSSIDLMLKALRAETLAVEP